MDKIQIIKFKPLYSKAELQVIDVDDIPIPEDFDVQQKNIVHLMPGGVGGNHKHPRTEIFVGFGDVEIFYEIDGEIKSLKFGSKIDELTMIIVPPYLPHAIKNQGSSEAILYEISNNKINEVEKVELIRILLR